MEADVLRLLERYATAPCSAPLSDANTPPHPRLAFPFFRSVWEAEGFSLLHSTLSSAPSPEARDRLYNEFFSIFLAVLSRDVHVVHKVGAVYGLYLSYATQPLNPPAPIRVGPWEWQRLRSLACSTATVLGPRGSDVGAVLTRLHAGGAFLLCAYSGPPGLLSIARGARLYGMGDASQAAAGAGGNNIDYMRQTLDAVGRGWVPLPPAPTIGQLALLRPGGMAGKLRGAVTAAPTVAQRSSGRDEDGFFDDDENDDDEEGEGARRSRSSSDSDGGGEGGGAAAAAATSSSGKKPRGGRVAVSSTAVATATSSAPPAVRRPRPRTLEEDADALLSALIGRWKGTVGSLCELVGGPSGSVTAASSSSAPAAPAPTAAPSSSSSSSSSSSTGLSRFTLWDSPPQAASRLAGTLAQSLTGRLRGVDTVAAALATAVGSDDRASAALAPAVLSSFAAGVAAASCLTPEAAAEGGTDDSAPAAAAAAALPPHSQRRGAALASTASAAAPGGARRAHSASRATDPLFPHLQLPPATLPACMAQDPTPMPVRDDPECTVPPRPSRSGAAALALPPEVKAWLDRTGQVACAALRPAPPEGDAAAAPRRGWRPAFASATAAAAAAAASAPPQQPVGVSAPLGSLAGQGLEALAVGSSVTPNPRFIRHVVDRGIQALAACAGLPVTPAALPLPEQELSVAALTQGLGWTEATSPFPPDAATRRLLSATPPVPEGWVAAVTDALYRSAGGEEGGKVKTVVPPTQFEAGASGSGGAAADDGGEAASGQRLAGTKRRR